MEVQVCPQGWFDDRCLFYSTYLIQSQIPSGKDDYTLKPVYVVSIDAFARNHSKENDGRTLYSYSLLEDTTHELMTDSLHFVFVELKKFEKKWQDIDNDKERFYFCLKHLHELDELDKQAQLNYARSQGLEEGLAKGKLETARKLKAEGIAIDVIAKCTGLTEEQIAKL